MTSQAEIGNVRVRLGIDSAEFANGVRNVQSSLSTLGSSIKTFATAAAAVTVFRQAVSALHDVADMGDVAEAIGLTAEQLQVYNRMALASGASAEVMARGLQTIAEQSTDAKSKLSELFDANGISAAGKEMNQVILDFMTLLQNAKSPAEQLAMATGVLGDKVGRQLVESLRAGAGGWNQAFNEMAQDGYYLANEQVKAAQAIETRYNQLISNLTSLWQKFVVNIVTGLDSIKFEYQPGRGGARSAVANRPMPGLPVSQTYDGKGDLPGNINAGGGYSVNKPTANPFNGISAPKASKGASGPKAPGAPFDSIDDIYGYGEAFKTLWDDMAQGIPTVDAVTQSLQTMADVMASTLADAIVGLLSGTMSLKEAFRSMAQSIGQQLEQLAAQIIKSQIFKLISMLAGSATGGMGFSFGGMSFGGFYADGGNLGSGKWGIAGENGPEIIHGPASITPMDKAGRGSPQMNVTVINNSSAQINTRKNSRGELEVLVEEIMSDKALRGGNKFDAAMQRGYGLRRAGR